MQVRRLPHHAGLPLPTRQTGGSAGYDVCSAEQVELVEVVELPASERGQGGFGSTGA